MNFKASLLKQKNIGILNYRGTFLPLLPDWDSFPYKEQWQERLDKLESELVYTFVLNFLDNFDTWLTNNNFPSKDSKVTTTAQKKEITNEDIKKLRGKKIDRTFLLHKTVYYMYQKTLLEYEENGINWMERFPKMESILEDINFALNKNYKIRTLQAIIKEGDSGRFD